MMKGIAIRRNENEKTTNAASIGGIHLFTKDLWKICFLKSTIDSVLSIAG